MDAAYAGCAASQKMIISDPPTVFACLVDLWKERRVDNFGEQLPPDLREFLTKIIVPLQGFILYDLRELDFVLDTDGRQEARRVVPVINLARLTITKSRSESSLSMLISLSLFTLSVLVASFSARW